MWEGLDENVKNPKGRGEKYKGGAYREKRERHFWEQNGRDRKKSVNMRDRKRELKEEN